MFNHFSPLIASVYAALAGFLFVWQLPKWIAWAHAQRTPTDPKISSEKNTHLDDILRRAGMFPTWNATRVSRWRIIGISIAVVLSLASLAQNGFTFFSIVSSLFFWYIAWKWPVLLLKQKIVRREREVLQTCSSFIDLLRLQIEAGLNLENAFRLLAEDRRDVWGAELRHVVFMLDRGASFDAALDALAERLPMDDIFRFTRAVKQARHLGVSLTDTLAIQAEMLRTRRRQRAEERTRLAAVKIALPLVFCIFPALLIIYLAPAALRLSKLF